jgi:hypothetical protein
MGHVLVFKSKSKNEAWMTASRNWQHFTKSEAIREYIRFTEAKSEQRTLMVEVNDLAQQKDLTVEMMDAGEYSLIEYKKIIKKILQCDGFTVIGRV